jgi:hypothetical protein
MPRKAKPKPTPETLGHVTAPSGAILVVDTGLLDVWCHHRPPVMLPGAYPESTVKAANEGVDYRIEGRDALAAGKAFDRSWHPLYVWDMAPPSHGGVQKAFAACVKQHKFKARLVPLPERVPHRRRIDLVLEHNPVGGEVFFFGAWGIVASGLPTDRSLPVLGERMPAGEFEGRWRSVWVESLPGVEVVRSELVGSVAVDKARLGVFDVDALGSWEHERPLDGLADFVLWGRDAETAARAVKAKSPGDGDYGWLDVPVRKLAERGTRVEQLRDKKGWVFATDFRPHSHHWQVMKQVRASATDSGTVEVGGAKTCTFMTSWGDGLYPVFRDLDATGRVVRIRLDLGNDDTVKRFRAMMERHFGEFAKRAIVTARVWKDGEPVRWLYRQATDREEDSGWRVFAGDEPPDYLADPDNGCLVPLRELVDRDKKLEAVFRSPVGSAFERREAQADFMRVEDYDPDEEE